MTAEKAIEILSDVGDINRCCAEDAEALDMAIKALEQQPCEDCISRADVKKYLSAPDANGDRVIYESDLDLLPPVTPQPKIGHWITEAQTYYEELKKRGLSVDEYTPYFTDDIACSECLAKYSVIDNETQFFKHCPNCGARMIESEEDK